MQNALMLDFYGKLISNSHKINGALFLSLFYMLELEWVQGLHFNMLV